MIKKYFYIIFILLLATVSSSNAQGQTRQTVSLELILLVDVSASVAEDEYQLQTIGLAAAFASQPVLDAVRSLKGKGLAVAVVQWADHEHQQVVVDWSVLRSAADVVGFADRIVAMPRVIHGGQTALGDALVFALNELNTNNYTGLHRIIDLSGDGRSNDGRALAPARADVLGQGITINGLAILNELPLLSGYFREQLIGGEGAFVMPANDYSDFARAMRLKLEREIRSAPLALRWSPLSMRRTSLGSKLESKNVPAILLHGQPEQTNQRDRGVIPIGS